MRYRPNQVIVATRDDLAAAHKFIDRIPLEEPKEGEARQRFVVSIKKFEDDASTAQKNLFHMWVNVIADDTGGDRRWVKTELKRKFFPLEFHSYKNPRTNKTETMEIVPSINDVKKRELSDIMNKIFIWAQTELGINLPLPEDLRWSIA